MSWKPMDTAPKDGTVIVLCARWPRDDPTIEEDVFFAYYSSEGHWDSLAEDIRFHTWHMRESATLLGWIEVPDSSCLAGVKAYRDGKLAREPGRLHLHKSSP